MTIEVQEDWPRWRKRLASLVNESGRSMREISIASGVSETYLRDAIVRGRIPTIERLELIEAELDLGASALVGYEKVRTITVKHTLQAGCWQEACEWPEEDQYVVPCPVGSEHKTLYAAELSGMSMSRWRAPGCIVIFNDLIETGEGLTPGKRYVVERINACGRRECTVKKLAEDKGGKYWLWPESDEPEFQSPLPLDGEDETEIRILGRVTHTIAPEV